MGKHLSNLFFIKKYCKYCIKNIFYRCWKIIKNMIVNYQLKLEILDKVLQHVQASPENLSNQKNLENEKINL